MINEEKRARGIRFLFSSHSCFALNSSSHVIPMICVFDHCPVLSAFDLLDGLDVRKVIIV